MLAVDLSLTDEIVLWITITAAVLSLIFNIRAMRYGIPQFRPVFTAAAVLSVLYLIGYLWLLGPAPTVHEWSSIMRGFSMVAWVAVWILPPIISVRVWRQLRDAFLQRVNDDAIAEVKTDEAQRNTEKESE